jgi:hypothetical protein
VITEVSRAFSHNVLEAVDWLDVTGDGGVKSLMIDNQGVLEEFTDRETTRWRAGCR